MASSAKSDAAFSEFRSKTAPRTPAAGLIEHENECLKMAPSDGLRIWVDGSAADEVSDQGGPPVLSSGQMDGRHLWVVRTDDVVHAMERSPFGKNVEKGVIKHTNLTGGEEAYSGGELIFLEETTVILNGRSGRYGPRSADEMIAVAKAFRKSGYYVWSCGYDDEAGRPYGFGSVDPFWVVST
ncbi:hypothetical protein [Mesorhizobium sp. IMUNJ 23232]|uniref:hypothetical protein n=1 Tax=Mesorhizobium sp. IMUNJ 23232 TaxID=3376064 RepID=UPI0037AFBA95